MEIDVEEVGPQNPSIGIASSSSSPGKFVCICVRDVDFNKYEWYVFDVSDDIQHNQPPPPPKYMNRVSRFHDDDDSRVVNLFPKVTANMDWILGWSILGSKMLYTVDDWTGDWRGRSAWKESNRVNRIDLTTPMAEWERLPRMPNQIASSAHIFVIGGMFYCLGGFPPQNKGLEWDSLSKMEYEKLFLSLNGEHDELPPPPCLDIDKLFSAPKPSPFTTPTPTPTPTPTDAEMMTISSADKMVPKSDLVMGLRPKIPSARSMAIRIFESLIRASQRMFWATDQIIFSANERVPNQDSLRGLRRKIPSADEKVSNQDLDTDLDTELERPSPWALAYDPSVNEWESLPDPPRILDTVDSIFSAAGEVPNPFVVVGSPEDRVLLIYHVKTRKWERQMFNICSDKMWERGEFEICPKFRPDVFTGSALAVESKLYWYSVHGLCLVGYDLVTNIWFEGNLPIHDCGEDFGVLEDDTPPRLAHIGGDKFCLLWVSVLPHRPMKISKSKDGCISRLHCMKLQVTTGNLDSDSKIFPLEVSILSCQSYLVPGLKFFRGGLVV